MRPCPIAFHDLAIGSTKAAAVTLIDGDGTGRHWGIYIRDEGDAITFLTYVAVKAVRDLAQATGIDHASALRLILAAIAEGVGEGDST